MSLISNQSESNVIQVSFGENINEIMHPASKNYPPCDEVADPLDELMKEVHHETLCEDSLSTLGRCSFEQSPHEIADTIINQLSDLKETSSRFRYYLDELKALR